MKKVLFAAGFVVVFATAASAQSKKQPPPPPPKPPSPSVEMKMVPPPPPPPPPPVVTKMPDDFADFLKRNPNVAMVNWNNNEVIIIPKKGKREHYALDEKGIAEAEAKYGKLPAAPPPPPPPPNPPVDPND